MTLAQHDDHRCQLRVLSSRHGQPLPIARSNGPCRSLDRTVGPFSRLSHRHHTPAWLSRRLSPAAFATLTPA
jgi:hypothetical protein